MTINIFYAKRSLFWETVEKAIVLNYDVIKDVMMMQCIYQLIKYLIQLKISIDDEYAVQWTE